MAGQGESFPWTAPRVPPTALDASFLLDLDIATFTATIDNEGHRGKFLGILDRVDVRLILRLIACHFASLFAEALSCRS